MARTHGHGNFSTVLRPLCEPSKGAFHFAGMVRDNLTEQSVCRGPGGCAAHRQFEG
jgi:hypothetical protein